MRKVAIYLVALLIIATIPIIASAGAVTGLKIVTEPKNAIEVGKQLKLTVYQQGADNPEYFYRIRINGVWEELSWYTTKNEVTYTPIATGNILIQVTAREKGTTTEYVKQSEVVNVVENQDRIYLKFIAWLIGISICSVLAYMIARALILNPIKYWARKAINNIF